MYIHTCTRTIIFLGYNLNYIQWNLKIVDTLEDINMGQYTDSATWKDRDSEKYSTDKLVYLLVLSISLAFSAIV